MSTFDIIAIGLSAIVIGALIANLVQSFRQYSRVAEMEVPLPIRNANDHYRFDEQVDRYRATQQAYDPPRTFKVGGHDLVCVCKGEKFVFSEKKNTLTCASCNKIIKIQAKVREEDEGI